MCKYSLLPTLIACSAAVLVNNVAVASTQPNALLDYDYVYASVSAGSLNENAGVNNNASAFSIGASNQVSQPWLLMGDYTARFIHPEDTTTRVDTLMGGGGYRYEISTDFDIVASYLLGITKAKIELNNSNDTISSDTEFIHGGVVAVNYGFADKWIVNGSIQANRSDLFDEEIYHFGLRYLVTTKFAIGGIYQHRDGMSDGNKERTNELGVEFFLEY